MHRPYEYGMISEGAYIVEVTFLGTYRLVRWLLPRILLVAVSLGVAVTFSYYYVNIVHPPVDFFMGHM